MQGTKNTMTPFVVLHSPTPLVAQQEIEGQVHLPFLYPNFDNISAQQSLTGLNAYNS